MQHPQHATVNEILIHIPTPNVSTSSRVLRSHKKRKFTKEMSSWVSNFSKDYMKIVIISLVKDLNPLV